MAQHDLIPYLGTVWDNPGLSVPLVTKIHLSLSEIILSHKMEMQEQQKWVQVGAQKVWYNHVAIVLWKGCSDLYAIYLYS